MSATAYTAANICMRHLSALHCPEPLAVCGRELVTTSLVVPWLIVRAIGGKRVVPEWGPLIRLVMIGLLLEIVANLCVQWAMGVVGIAVAIPSQFGASIINGAIWGSLLLGEKVSLRTVAAIGLLVSALAFLGLGAESAGQAVASEASGLRTVLAVAAACLSGTICALLLIVIRHSVTTGTPVCSIAFLIPFMGVVGPGSIAVNQLGISTLSYTSPAQLGAMLAAGIFNLVGFIGLILGLQQSTVVRANVINASQVAIAAVAGMFLFQERATPWLFLGVGFAIVGIVWIAKPGGSSQTSPCTIDIGEESEPVMPL